MKYLIYALFFVVFSQKALGALGLELVPKGRPFPLTFADPREIRLAIGFESDSKISGVVGNYFSLFGIRSEENPDWFFHVGLEGAGYFTMRQADKRFPLETVDGLIGFYTETRVNSFQYQFRYTHISAHLADGSNDTPVVYTRESAIFRVGYFLTPNLHFYSGVHYLMNTVPKLPTWGFQIGSTAFFPYTGNKICPFGAFDMKFKGEYQANPALNLQIGIAFGNAPEMYRSFRFFYSYYTGEDPRGQYYHRILTNHSLGIEMQI